MPNNTDKIKVNTKIQATLPPKPEVGIDLENNFQDKIIEAADVSSLDLSKIEAFSNVAQTRDQIYSTIDTMCLDSTLSAVLDTYVEDTVETNDKGQIVWAESNEDNVGKYVNFLLQSLKVDKNIHAWALKLTKYGDLYWRLYKQSDLDNDDAIFKGTKQDLKEAVNLQLHSKNDHYTHYIEAADNPSELFELTRFGKTAGYIQAPVTVQSTYDTASGFNNFNLLRYKVKRKDISVFSSTDYVHACLEDNSNRVPEEVNIFTGDSDGYDDDENSISYKVRRGESIFSNSFKVWRELSLLENSILLNRLTKSSIVRVLNVEVGDMPKEQVDTFMGRLKSKIEQKSAIDTYKSMAEYTNPGPIENTIYIPTHEGKGAINAQTIGGDVDVKALTDLSYFQDKLFGSLKVPKQFFGITEDSAGFSGGKSLSIISSRYGKSIKRIQNTLCQGLTDVINLFLLDSGLTSYIGKFTIRMQAPITQEEIDTRENKDNRIRYVSDVMQQLNDIQDPAAKLKILKSLLSGVINDPDIIVILQDEIDKLERGNKDKQEKENHALDKEENNIDLDNKEPADLGPIPEFNGAGEEQPTETEEPIAEEPVTEEQPENTEDSFMPSPADLDQDMTQNQ